MADPASTPAASEVAPEAGSADKAAPPGYVLVDHAPNAGSPALPVAAFVVLTGAAFVGLVNELVVAQPRVYLVPGSGPARGWAVASFALGAALGMVVPSRRDPRPRLMWAMLALAVVAAASAPAWFYALGRGVPLLLPTLAVPFVAGVLLAHGARTARQALGVAVARLGVLEYLLSPFRLLGIAVVLGAAASAEATVGPLRAAAFLAMAVAALAGWCPSLFSYVDGERLAGTRISRWAATAVLFGSGVVLALSQRWVPVQDVARFTNTVVYAERGERQSLAVTSGQDALELFVDGRLKVSMVDQQRYFEALVHPALVAAPRRDRVLLVGGGSGMAEREILRHEDVGQLTVVVLDRALPALVRRMRWTRRLSKDALESPKIRWVEAEAIVWLGDSDEQFDAVIVDLPDPLEYLDAKSYSVHFYRLLARHLAPGGVAAVQATSAFYSPRTFDAIRASMAAAGLSTRGYHAPVPTFGDWGFLLASGGPTAPEPDGAKLAPLLHGVSVGDLEVLPPDVHVAVPSPANRLFDLSVVEIFAEERHEAGL